MLCKVFAFYVLFCIYTGTYLLSSDLLLNNLQSFETFIPETVDLHGNFLSYHVKPPSRKRRSAKSGSQIIDDSDISEYRIFYRFSVFGKEFHFDLTLNTDFLAPGFQVEYQDRKGVIGKSSAVANCYYVGQSRKPFISTAAISNCYGLVGASALLM